VSKPRQGRVNGTAEKLASVAKDSCRIVTRSAVSVQALNARLTQNFFNAVTTNLHVSLHDNRQVAQHLMFCGLHSYSRRRRPPSMPTA
jgi:hypothetical protein